MGPSGKVAPANGWREKHGVRTHYVNGVVHHDTEPAYVNKAKGITEWRRNGKRDRRDGPALIETAGGPVRVEQWWVKGRRLTVTSLKAYASERFPQHTNNELAVLAYIVDMGLPLEIEHILRRLEDPRRDPNNIEGTT